MKHREKQRIKNNLWTLAKVWAWLTVGGMLLVVVVVTIVLIAVLGGAPGASEPTAPPGAYSLPVPAGASPNVKAAVDAAWPKVLAACPGLLRYGADLTYQGIEDNEAHAGPTARRISILVRVADNPAQIPDAYMAHGHTCQFEISAGGQALTIQKRPCAALCRDDAAMLGNLAETVVGLR
jgi:hypothetical protein